jgi:hypothetical protein
MRTSSASSALLISGLVTVAMSACSAPVSQDFSSTGRSPAAIGSTACSLKYDEGAYSLDIMMQNDTGQTLTLNPDWTGRGDGHWAARPPTTLDPGACAVINAYSDDPTGGLWLTATYQLPDGTFIPFACASKNLDGGGAECNNSAYTTMKGMDPDSITGGTPSTSWHLSTAASTGFVHTHLTVVAAPLS